VDKQLNYKTFFVKIWVEPPLAFPLHSLKKVSLDKTAELGTLPWEEKKKLKFLSETYLEPELFL